jgi:hypothetical protein
MSVRQMEMKIGWSCFIMDTPSASYFCNLVPSIYDRKNELHQVAQQASNIEDLTEVVRASLSVMSRQWSDAMHTSSSTLCLL